MSKLIYDDASKKIRLYATDGRLIGGWDANNNVDSHVGLAALPDGEYPFVDTKHAHRHHGDSSHGGCGPAGIVRLVDFKVDGVDHSGVGVHSGRKGIADGIGRMGVNHCTHLCIRTTDSAMSMITMTMQQDPLDKLVVCRSRVGRRNVHITTPHH